MIVVEHRGDAFITLRASGRLSRADYEAAVPGIENALQSAEGPLRVLVALEDFRGWDMGALWKELRFDVKHRKSFGRVAVIGESPLEAWGTRITAPFFGADVRFFDVDRRQDAENWLSERDAPPSEERAEPRS